MVDDARARAERYLREDTGLRQALGIPEGAELTVMPIGQGEYNANFSFVHPSTRQCLVLRLNYGSQMHLDDQIAYEYRALQLVESSGRTPSPRYCDPHPASIPNGVLVMDFVEGAPLDYDTDMDEGLHILADIHAVSLPCNHGLIAPADPLADILEECETMFDVYRRWEHAERRVTDKVEAMLAICRSLVDTTAATFGTRHIINTELNSTNFLIPEDGSPGSLVDWEKPVAGSPAQDLAMFLSPAATFWKTDTFFTREQMEGFIEVYIDAVAGRFDTDGLNELFASYLPLNSLRGISWCAMACVEYARPDRDLRNESTLQKIGEYISDEYLGQVCDVCFPRKGSKTR